MVEELPVQIFVVFRVVKVDKLGIVVISQVMLKNFN
jgi:hypothetical protein